MQVTTVRARLEAALAEPASADAFLLAQEVNCIPDLDPRELVLLSALWSRLAAAAQGEQWIAQHKAALPFLEDTEDGRTDERAGYVNELELAMRRTNRQVESDLDMGEALDVMPAMRELLREGRVSVAHARTLAEQTRHLDPMDRRWLDLRLTDHALTRTSVGFARLVRRAVAKLDREHPARRRARIRRALDVTLRHGVEPGTAEIVATLGQADAVAVMNALQAAAEALREAHDPRTTGERRVAALKDAVGLADPDRDEAVAPAPAPETDSPTDQNSDPAGDPDSDPAGDLDSDSAGDLDGELDREPEDRPRPGGGVARTEIIATIDLPTLLGLRALLNGEDSPAELHRYGPVEAQEIRDLLASAGTTIRRLVYDPVDGRIVDFARRTYRVRGTTRRFLDARDTTCRSPGCSRAADYCDVEHCTAFDRGGASEAANTALFCRRHHRCKTRGQTSYVRLRDLTNAIRLRTGLGFSYDQQATTYGPDGPDPGGYARSA